MLSLLKRLWSEEDGQGMVEYGLILALVAVVAITALEIIGDGVVATFEEVVDALGKEEEL